MDVSTIFRTFAKYSVMGTKERKKIIGNTHEELRKDFEDGVDSYLEACKADGIEPAKPYSGRLNLRMSSELHSRVAAFVATTGTTINDFINKAIKNELNHAAIL